MNKPFPSSHAASSSYEIKTLEHVRIAIKAKNPDDYRLAAFRRLETLLQQIGQPLLISASEAAINAILPKAKKGIHPRPDFNCDLASYKRTRGDLINAVREITGTKDKKQALRKVVDEWTQLRAAVDMHTAEGGLIHKACLIALDKLIVFSREAKLLPTDMATKIFIPRLEAVLTTNRDYDSARRALKCLSDFSFIDEISICLPNCPVPQLIPVTARQELPDAVKCYVDELLKKAYFRYDKVMGEDVTTAAQSTIDRARSALRYHFLALPKCPADPRLGFPVKVTNLEHFDDLAILLSEEFIHATIRYTSAVKGQAQSISPVTAYAYYSDILTVMSRNGFEMQDLVESVKKTKFMVDAKEEREGMSAEAEDWCRRLLTDPKMERRFRNLHRIFQDHADQILVQADKEGRSLTSNELQTVRQYGMVAAACAIEYAGRPIRSQNVLDMRLYGPRRNFFTPADKAKKKYGFTLEKAETKAKKGTPFAELRSELYGPQVMSWYLEKIRPLFPFADESIHLFPGFEQASQRLSKETFRLWFQKAATAAGIPMTFHRWRHGYGSLLMAENWGNLQIVADMLNNTRAVADEKYAFIIVEDLYRDGQDIMIKTAKANKKKALAK